MYAPEVQVCLLPLVSLMKLRFSFSSNTNGLDIMYGGNLLGHATLINNFLILDLGDC